MVKSKPGGAEETADCPRCGEPLGPRATFCTNCGYKVKSGKRGGRPSVAREWAKDTHKKSMRRARKVILVLAILLAVVGVGLYALIMSELSSYGRYADADVVRQAKSAALIFLLMYLGIAGLYFGCFIWAKSNPVAATTVATILYVTLKLAEVILNPSSLLNPFGLFITACIIAMLVYGIKSAIAYDRMEKEDRRRQRMVASRQ
jgi:FtsH-binding integral membrane protein